MILTALLSRRWRWMTLAAVLACAVTVWLGFWQLGRLAARRALNAQLAARLHAPPLPLSGLAAGGFPTGTTLKELEFRPVLARGTFDYAAEVAIANQVKDGKLGFHVLTPLILEGGSHAVLVDRGWIPMEAVESLGALGTSPVPDSMAYRSGNAPPAEVTGWIRLGHPAPANASAGGIGASAVSAISGVSGVGAAGASLPLERILPVASVEAVQARVMYPLLPVIIVQAPSTEAPGGALAEAVPYREAPLASLGDGVHLVAATQWFAIGGIILVGLLAYVRKHAASPARPLPDPPAASHTSLSLRLPPERAKDKRNGAAQ